MKKRLTSTDVADIVLIFPEIGELGWLEAVDGIPYPGLVKTC